MSEYYAKVIWNRRNDEKYIDNEYSRGHEWEFDGGVTIPASSSPHVVPIPYSVEANVDPEEAFVASLSACHMLTFLAIAAKRRFVVDAYSDHAVGYLEETDDGRLAITRVELRPEIAFSGDTLPTPDQIESMHRLSHQECFIANSVTAEIVVLPPTQ